MLPNGLGGAIFGGMSTSTNDIGPGLVAYGVGNLYPTFGTTSVLEHGGGAQNPDNILQSAGAVWSTGNAQPTLSQYTLDLGGTFDVTTVRMWPRADTCCANRWQNLEIQLLDSNRNPIAGTRNTFAGNGTNTPLEFKYPTVPEPGTLALLGLTGTALLLRRRT